MRRILAVKLADLGDVLLCEPALRSLRDAFPSSEIDVLVPPTSAKLVELLNLDLQAITFDKSVFDHPRSLRRPSTGFSAAGLGWRLRRRRYSAVVLLHHLTTASGAAKYRALVRAVRADVVAGLDNGRGTFLTHRANDLGFGYRHESEYMLQVAEAIGGAHVDVAPRFTVSVNVDHLGLPPKYVAIHPVTGAYAPARTWDPERWADVAAGLHVASIDAVIVGAGDASEAAQKIRTVAPRAVDLTGATTIMELAGVLKGAACVIGGDSFAGHLAAAVGSRTVSVFGPSNADAWGPYGDSSRHQIVQNAMPCQPCIYTGFTLGRRMGCPDRTCLRRVSTDDVLAMVVTAYGAA